jgi:AcrR family transcriptional regulator
MAGDASRAEQRGRVPDGPAPARKGRPPAANGVDTRRRIVVAARGCFGRNGYDKTINKDIAAAAGITQAAIYHYFPSKRDVFVAAYREMQETTFARFEAVVATETTLVAKVKAMLDLAADMHASDRTLATFTSVAPIEIQRHPDLRKALGDEAATVYRFFQGVVDASRSDLRADIDPVSVVNLLVAVTAGFSQFGATARADRAHRDAIEALERLVDGTLFAHPPAEARPVSPGPSEANPQPKRRRLVTRPPAVDRSDTRARILAAARARFGAYGYDITTNKDIGAAAGFTAGAIYRYFPSKADLFVDVYRETQRTVLSQFDAALADRRGIAEKIKAVLDLSVDMHAADRTLATFTAVAPVEIQRHPELRAALGPDTLAVYRFFEQMVAEDADRDLASGVNPDSVVNLLVAVATGFSQFGALTRAVGPHREAIDSFQRLIDGALFTAATRASGAVSVRARRGSGVSRA